MTIAAAIPHGRHCAGRVIDGDRRARLRLLVGSQVGVGCLVLAHGLQPGDATSLIAAPAGLAAWIAVIAGIAGIWLVPGSWLSALVVRTGAGPVAWFATRIGLTLVWYALAGPVIHVAALGARVTTGGIIGLTVAATAAVSLGLGLGLARRPANPRVRLLTAALAGGIFAQTVIWLSMRLYTDGVSYEHIRRLDLLIVLACGLLTAAGAAHRPDLPLVHTAGDIRAVGVAVGVVAATAMALVIAGSLWSPAQQLSSAIGVEQVPPPPGADAAFALTAVGPKGAELIQRAAFTAFDDAGRRVAARMRVVGDGMAGGAMLVVVLEPSSRPQLCERAADVSKSAWPMKLTVQEQISGVLSQADMPPGWCPR